MANDKNGTQLFVGDEIVLRARVTHVQGDHVLTLGLEAPSREFWFQGNVVERAAQGAASLDADAHATEKPVAAVAEESSIKVEFGAIPAGGVPSLLSEVPLDTTTSKREEAVAYVMTKVYRDTERPYTKEQAEAVVDEYGYGRILDDRDEEAKQETLLAREISRSAGSTKVPPASTAPASTATTSQAPTGASGSAPAQPAAGAPQNEAPKEADGSAPASSGAA